MNSLWNKELKEIDPQRALKKNITTDVLIIGGGITGILCAYKLTKQGKECILVEKNRICQENTQNTTAKITAQHGIIYDRMIKRFGVSKARQYYDANTQAIDEYRKLAKQIPCDFEEKTAYLYSVNHRNKLEKEAAAYDKLGIPYHWQEQTPLPFPTCGAIGMEKQAQFHPIKLLKGLLPSIRYYENTFVTKIDDHKAITSQGVVITAKHIILATHYPLVNIPGLYFMKLIQNRSHVLALQDGADVKDMYISENKNGYSFRNYQNMLLLGGGAHKPGKKGGGFLPLKELSKKEYPDAKIEYAWAAQDCMTLDQIPYIGVHHKSTSNLYTATGFCKWGMTSSMVAASVLTDLITTGKSDYQTLFSPQRSMLRPALFANIISAAAGILRVGKRCTHMGCALRWNSEEQSFDCSCHGSRFHQDGKILDNPAKKDISNKVKLK